MLPFGLPRHGVSGRGLHGHYPLRGQEAGAVPRQPLLVRRPGPRGRFVLQARGVFHQVLLPLTGPPGWHHDDDQGGSDSEERHIHVARRAGAAAQRRHGEDHFGVARMRPRRERLGQVDADQARRRRERAGQRRLLVAPPQLANRLRRAALLPSHRGAPGEVALRVFAMALWQVHRQRTPRRLARGARAPSRPHGGGGDAAGVAAATL
mmetsp:Transcript_589/g.2148  ORF Transcript_589/g.2148 Transcript_589/m.2148 type:complete len:208 (-) Transcript_589:1003-1626(-)